MLIFRKLQNEFSLKTSPVFFEHCNCYSAIFFHFCKHKILFLGKKTYPTTEKNNNLKMSSFLKSIIQVLATALFIFISSLWDIFFYFSSEGYILKNLFHVGLTIAITLWEKPNLNSDSREVEIYITETAWRLIENIRKVQKGTKKLMEKFPSFNPQHMYLRQE